jgi:hypothetical protein
MSEKLVCENHPEAGIHFGEHTKKTRCNYCNSEVKLK